MSALLLWAMLAASLAGPARPAAGANDNRAAAGVIHDGVLTLRLRALEAGWFPEADSGPSQVIQAFAEEGHRPTIPGPLIRVPTGTMIRVVIRNALPGPTLTIYGLHTRPGRADDTVQVRAGATREISFAAGAPGTYFYWGSTSGRDIEQRDGADSQLDGAFIVDSAGTAGPPADRIFVMGAWHENPDTTGPKPWIPRDMMVINGKSWPYTERLNYQIGDTVHWRWLNPTSDAHPMHLHGFYFTVTGRGAWAADTAYSPDGERLAVTETMLPGGTMTLRWVPTEPGNWLFHCHFGLHVSHFLSLNKIPDDTIPDSPAEVDHTAGGMRGLVLGIHVRGAAPRPAAGAKAPRPIRLFMQAAPLKERPRFYTYAFVVQQGDSTPAADSVPQRSSPLVLRRGEAVRITMVNRLPYPSAVHWHGIEIQNSYVDGVPGWSGSSGHVAPLVMPGDSFTVSFTPPRAGTFIYHSHSNEYYQIAAGLAAPLIVLDSGAVYDSATDRTFLINQGIDASGRLNGKSAPDTLRLTAGLQYRFRFINIAPDWRVRVTLADSSGPVQWRSVAKDGADLPPRQATTRAAELKMGPGETADFSFTPEPGRPMALEIATQLKGWGMKVPIVVDAR
ncbi:MAG TPA: multicopper oxidase domain-containing protein [Gemmatimonadales bacterium]|nr:multicopper oxidase domain-containing protein [Gemmatimonadales bacterium]